MTDEAAKKRKALEHELTQTMTAQVRTFSRISLARVAYKVTQNNAQNYNKNLYIIYTQL